MRAMPHVSLPDGRTAWPCLGLGTWRMGEAARSRRAEVAAVRQALEMGYRLIDTAEMYGDGGAEEVVGEALAATLRAGEITRDELVIVSKVLPGNASRRGTVQACDRSRRRLGLDRIDLYLLHWQGSHPLRDTLAAFEQLQSAGAITHWGVSNFDLGSMKRLLALAGGERCAANQVYYSLGERGIDFDLKPWHLARGLPLMAYSPIDQGAIARHARLSELARPLGVTAAQLALAWTLREGGVVAIPKAVREAHLRDNLAAGALKLDAPTRAALDALFPPPCGASPLAMT
jgi:diketogulonate reductase-like aldo/keto reductase